MVTTYKRPGVYLEEQLMVNPGADIASSVSVGGFIGVARQGPGNTPILIDSWNSFVSIFGGFGLITPPAPLDPNDLTRSAFAGYTQPTTLAALKADPVIGDTKYTGPTFVAGSFAYLNDPPTFSKVHYTAAAWATGAMTGTAQATVPKPPPVLSYLPYAVYSFFQNGGRLAWIIRSTPQVVTAGAPAPAVQGLASSVSVDSVTTATPPVVDTGKPSFKLNALSEGTWGNALAYNLVLQNEVVVDSTTSPVTKESIFALQILSNGAVVETFTALSMTGQPGTRRLDVAVNDPNNNAGSRYVRVSELSFTAIRPKVTTNASGVNVPVALTGGVEPAVPLVSDMEASANAVGQIEGPINLNVVGYLSDGTKEGTDQATFVTTILDPPTKYPEREDIVYFNDSAPPRKPSDTPAGYKTAMSSALNRNTNSYSASYGPWIMIPDPSTTGNTIAVPPAGAVIGMAARIDATMGVFRAPAGVVADLLNAVGVQTKFTDAELGDLNAQSINMIRTLAGAGICVMGARTRKNYGPDKYLSARRTLISIKESLRNSTQWAVFENNDEMLWTGLASTADRILRPLWEQGGLKGESADDAYYVRCDETINTATVIQAGEVRMEVGVALQYPAEFVIIKITQFEEGSFTTEVQPVS